MKKVSLIVYDFDGTLVDTLEDIALGVNLTLRELELRELSIDVIQNHVGRGVENLMRQSLAGTGYTDIPGAVTLFRNHYGDHLTDKTDFYPTCRETLDHFSAKTQAVCSNKPEDFVRQILTDLDGARYFQDVIGGDTLATKKPDPQCLHTLMQRFQVPPEEALIVGDSVVDIQTGKAAAVMTCVVTYGNGDPDEMRAHHPDWTIDTLSTLKTLVI